MNSVKRASILVLLVLTAISCVSQPGSPSTVSVTGIPATQASVSQPDAIELSEKFHGLLIKQDYANAVGLFDQTMQSALPENKLKEIWDGLQQQFGAYQGSLKAKPVEHIQQYERITIPLQFEKMTLDMQVAVDSNTGQISGLFFKPSQDALAQQYKTPAYVDPNAFEEREITIGADPWKLPGTLTLPKGQGPFPAVVLGHGSGPNDRDETVGANKPFKDIAQGLASRGVAVLRYDKRTKVYGDVMAKLSGELTAKEETIDDAVAAVDVLRNTPGIDPKKIFVLGHSLGGYLAPRIAQADPNIAGLVILAGPTRPLEDLMLEQTRYILESDGSLSAQDQLQIGQIQQQVEAVKALTAQSSSKDSLLGAPVSYWLDLKNYRPAELASKLSIPMLFLQGERDYQVTLQDLQGWKQALAGKANAQIKSYSDLNHLFMSGTEKSTPAEYQIPGNVSARVIEDIAAWAKAR